MEFGNKFQTSAMSDLWLHERSLSACFPAKNQAARVNAMLTTVNRTGRPETRYAESQELRFTCDRDICNSKILIVDDEPLNIEVVSRYLREGGFSSIVSTDHAGQARFR